MKIVKSVLIVVISIQHFLFLILEMFLWKTPIGLRIFGMTQEAAELSATLAANQGLYNGFLSAGLIWSLLIKANKKKTQIFFLICVIIAGLFGGYTVKYTIYLIQALPAFIALLFILAEPE
jgi:putative membrane protein